MSAHHENSSLRRPTPGKVARKSLRDIADDGVGRERTLTDNLLKSDHPHGWETGMRQVDRERALSDCNLERERREQDQRIERSETMFTAEHAAHDVTKVALASRDDFLAIVSHDLRNPIGAISMAATLLLESEATDNGDVHFYAELIQRGANEALRLIGDLQDIEAMAIGKFEMELEQQDVGEIVLEVTASFQQIAKTKGVNLSAVSPDALLIACDRGRITQVLSNLIGNALKFVPSGASIELRAAQLSDEVLISVTDNGPGIPEAMTEAIFRRFSQLGKKDRRGLGLGLHISKTIVEAHHGRIWVESREGHGSAFYVALPINAPASRTAPPGPTRSPS